MRWQLKAFGIHIVLLIVTFAQAQGQDVWQISSENMRGIFDWIALPAELPFSPIDDPSFAQPDYDHTAWQIAPTRLLPGDATSDAWTGTGWFRLRFKVDSTLHQVPLGLRIEQRGASEIYLDGELLYAVGSIGATPEETEIQLQRTHVVFSLDERDDHVLAVRYAVHNVDAYHQVGLMAGFYLDLVANVNTLTAAREVTRWHYARFQLFFTGVFITFALLHLILFVFYPQAIENLYLALLLGTFVGVVYVFHQGPFTTNPSFWLYQGRSLNTLSIVLSILALLFVYRVFYDRMPRYFYGVVGFGFVANLTGWLFPHWSIDEGTTFTLAACLELLRVVAVALVKKKPGARIIGVGVGILAFSIVLFFLFDREVLTPFRNDQEIPFFGMLVLTIAMSVHLSRNIAQTNRDLRTQLVRVQELSDEALEQERRLHEQEVERKLMEAEYQQKLHELEEARQLQLSMLPETVPEHPLVELATYMQPATEVGGDYYDFHTEEDGTLTIAVGDATGHGMKAGTMVTATKSLFNALGQEANLLSIFSRSTRALKQMNMRKLFMALTLAKFKEGSLRLATAGMPATLLYRAATDEVEVIELKAMPLGSFVNFPYKEKELTLEVGDTVLFMSDGFPELFNEAGEMLGYDQAVQVFAGIAEKTPEAIIADLVEEGSQWAKGRAPDDDMTFVVMKVTGKNEHA